MVQECLTYVIDDKGGTNAQEGCHDDTVMATAILLQALLEGRGENYRPVVIEEKRTNTPVRKRGFRQHVDKDLDDKSGTRADIKL